jgi:hypothetical protein
MDDDPDVLSARIEEVRQQLPAAWKEDGAVTARVLAWSQVVDAWGVRWHRAQEPNTLGYRQKAGG